MTNIQLGQRLKALNEFIDSGQMMIMSKHNQQYLINMSLCSSGNYNSNIAAKLNLTLIVKGSRAQLKQIPFTIMVTKM